MPETTMAETTMADKILEVFQRVIPCLTERGQEKLLSYGEGMLAIIQDKDKAETAS